jgi:hypothetical protein
VIAHTELRNIGADFRHDPGDFVAEDRWHPNDFRRRVRFERTLTLPDRTGAKS